MARKTEIVLVDDLDGSIAAETVTFGLDGKLYELELSAKNATALRGALSEYIGAGRRMSSGKPARAAASSGSSSSRADSVGGPSAAVIRNWAIDNGYEVSSRGRVSAAIQEAYAARTT